MEAEQIVRAHREAERRKTDAEVVRQAHLDQIKFQVGDIVLLYHPQVPKGVSSKLFTHWKGPYQIMEQTGPLNYKIRANGISSTDISLQYPCSRAVLQTSILGQAIVLDLEKNAARRLSFAKALAPTNSPLAELSIPPTTSSKGAVQLTDGLFFPTSTLFSTKEKIWSIFRAKCRAFAICQHCMLARPVQHFVSGSFLTNMPPKSGSKSASTVSPLRGTAARPPQKKNPILARKAKPLSAPWSQFEKEWLLEDGVTDPGALPALWRPLLLGFLALFAFLIAWQITARPLHHDEGVNCFFMERLIENNDWKYDPENYHGPILYYVTLVFVWLHNFAFDEPFTSLAGMTVTCIRSVPAVVGVLHLLLIAFGTRHRLGNLGALLAVVLTGFCNDQLWISRYFIHENFFTFFTLAVYVCGTKYFDTNISFWIALLGASCACLHASKEFAVVHCIILLLADMCSRVALWILNKCEQPWPLDASYWGGAKARFQQQPAQPLYFLLAFVAVWLPLFSSFFTNFQGLIDSVRTYSYWFKTGFGVSGHEKPFLWWLYGVLFPTETFPTLAAIVSGCVVLWKREQRGLMLLFWALGNLGCYSLLPYKTVWCVPAILLPMLLLNAYGFATLIGHFAVSPRVEERLTAVAGVLAAIALGILFDWVVFAYDLNYVRWDGEGIYPQPYVHTTREIYPLIDWIDRAAAADGRGRDMPLRFTCDPYHPLPFYLLPKYHNITWGVSDSQVMDDVKEFDIMIAAAQQKEVRELLPPALYESRPFHLRLHADVVAYVRKSIAGPVSHIPPYMEGTPGPGSPHRDKLVPICFALLVVLVVGSVMYSGRAGTATRSRAKRSGRASSGSSSHHAPEHDQANGHQPETTTDSEPAPHAHSD
eukprot:g42310.t1